MNYKSYPTKKNTPSRKTRKGMRFSVFTANKAMRNLAKKKARLSRRIVD